MRHYFSLGIETVYLIDNESTDRTAELARAHPGVVVTDLDSGGELDDRLRSETFDAYRRACAGQYDWVLVVDVDELVVPKEGSLRETLLRHQEEEVLGCSGFEVVGREGEPPFDPARPPLAQRRCGFPSPAYDKPVVLRPSCPARLAPGQHYLQGEHPHEAVSPFWLFHLPALDETLFRKRRRQVAARQGKRNASRGHGKEYTGLDEEGITRLLEALRGHALLQPLPEVARDFPTVAGRRP